MEVVREQEISRQERAAQIVTAASVLLLRHGYQRITMEDVAREAGVGTGTLYLHWKSKESLFETVLLRELVAIWDELSRRLDADPTDALLHRLLSHLLRAVKQRPLAQALFTRDTSLLGKLAQRSTILQAQPLANGEVLITMLRELGLMRSDTALDVQSYAFSAIWTGFSLVDPLLSADDQAPLDTQIAALSAAVRATFEPEQPPDAATLREQIAPAVQGFLREAQAVVERQIQTRML